MTKIPLFPSINYARPKSCAEGTLSTVSNYFYLGGTQVTVVKEDEVRLETGKISWYKTVIKVVSYVLLFPLTLILLTINFCLRSQRNFTVITSPQPKRKLVQESGSAAPPSLKTEEQAQIFVSPAPAQELTRESITEVIQREPKPLSHSVVTSTVPSIESACQQVLAPSPSRETPFLPFTIKISYDKSFLISSLEKMRLKVAEISQEVLDQHSKLPIDIPLYGLERAQALKLIEELRTIVDVIPTRWQDLFYVMPKKTEESQENLLVRRYSNGIIEKVQSASADDWTYWKGERLYPDGVIETGRFENFRWHQGARVEKGTTTYRLPNTLVHNYTLNRGLMHIEDGEEKKLIVISSKSDASAHPPDYVQIDEDPILTMARIGKERDWNFNSEGFKELLSDPEFCGKFTKFLFETNEIFSLSPYLLRILLQIIQEKGLTVNLRQQHPKTKETLLDRYSIDTKALRALLSIDPHLIQRVEGTEIPLVRALLTGNKEGASILLAAMKEQDIPLLPREILFKKIAFSEGEVAQEELQTLSQEDREIAYRLANICSQLNVVRTMRTLGFGRNEPLLMQKGPSIFGYNMDALEMHDQLQSFLMRLRSEKLLLTRSEYNQLPAEDYIAKGNDIGRILGRDYIERKAGELGLKHVKVPKKMIVVDDDIKLALRINEDLSIGPSSDGIAVYAERIEKSSRRVTPEEVSELLRLFEATGFSDINWQNIVVAKEGVYIIDTEFTNFWVMRFYFEGGGQYVGMANIVHALPAEQQKLLIEELHAKIEAYQKQEEELNEQRGLRLQVERAALQKTGCFYGPSFTFSANELMNTKN